MANREPLRPDNPTSITAKTTHFIHTQTSLIKSSIVSEKTSSYVLSFITDASIIVYIPVK